jgi:hypothetical protein
MNIVYVNHGAGKDFAFRVPDEMVKHIHKGDIVVCETMYGVKVGICQTGVITGDGALDKAISDGAYQPLKPIIGKLYPELKPVIVEDIRRLIMKGLAESNDKMPF